LPVARTLAFLAAGGILKYGREESTGASSLSHGQHRPRTEKRHRYFRGNARSRSGPGLSSVVMVGRMCEGKRSRLSRFFEWAEERLHHYAWSSMALVCSVMLYLWGQALADSAQDWPIVWTLGKPVLAVVYALLGLWFVAVACLGWALGDEGAKRPRLTVLESIVTGTISIALLAASAIGVFAVD